MYHISLKEDKPDIEYMRAKVTELMKRGIKLHEFKELKDYYVNLRDTLKQNFSETYGVQNPNSVKQLVALLVRLSNSVELGSRNDIIENCYNDQDNKWTTNKDALGNLAALGYEFAQDLLDYRSADSYAKAILSLEDNILADGLIHPEVSLTKTNRISYTGPALMNIPKELLWRLVAPFNSGDALYSIDIKNQEPSILAYMTGAVELKEALESNEGMYESLFKQCFKPCCVANVLIDTFMENRVYSVKEISDIGTISPRSYYAQRPQTTEQYYNGEKVKLIETICAGGSKGVVPKLPDKVHIETENDNTYEVSVTWEEKDIKTNSNKDYSVRGYINDIDMKITPIERKEFKTSYLAITYGAAITTIKNSCKHIDGERVYKFVTGIKAIKEYKSNINKLIRQGVTTIGSLFGTVLQSGTNDPGMLKRILLDLPIQGTGADILSLLLKHFYERMNELSLADKLFVYYTRHDELIVEVDGQWLNEVGSDKVVDLLKDTFEHQINDWTPFKIEIERVDKMDKHAAISSSYDE